MSLFVRELSVGSYAVGVTLALACVWAVSRVLRAPTSRVPGPWYTKWTGLVADFHFLNGSRPYYVDALHQIYGPVVRVGPNEVAIMELEAVKTIYSTKETFRKADFYRTIGAPGQQSMFSTTDVDFHRRHRRLLASPLSETSLKSLVAQVRSRIDLAVERMGDEMRSKGATNVAQWWLFMATDVIGELTFGQSFQMLELGKANAYARDLDRIGRVGAIRSTFPSLVRFSQSVTPLPLVRDAVDATRNMRRYADESLNRYRRLVEADPGLSRQTLFTKVFQAEADNKMPFNEIRDEAQSFIIAGSDTTANTLTFLTWSVCRHPRVRARLVDELRDLPPDFDEARLRDLPFLNQVIDETLRLYSAAPSTLPREVPPGGAELAGYWP
ncbi:hypothetical protein CDD83_9030 [Cordyceps sp. RAO-2017]|nr:hypothetical protein CDD83_9030 [Cordyceps sp. RAO-2017]